MARFILWPNSDLYLVFPTNTFHDEYVKYLRLAVVFVSHSSETSLFKPKILAVWLENEDRYCGLNLQDIVLPDCCYFLGILRQDKIILANSDPVLQGNDLLIAIAINPMFTPALLDCLKERLRIGCWLETQPIHWSDSNCHH